MALFDFLFVKIVQRETNSHGNFGRIQAEEACITRCYTLFIFILNMCLVIQYFMITATPPSTIHHEYLVFQVMKGRFPEK